MTSLIQSVILPGLSLCSEERLYFRGDNLSYSYTTKRLFVPENAKAVFNTFFNSLSIKKWKKYTNLKTLQLSPNVCGVGMITIKCSINGTISVLNQKEYDSDFPEDIEIDISGLTQGFLYIEWQSKIDSYINGFEFLTNDHVSDIRLALIVTTFNRVDVVKNTIHRFDKELLNDIRYKKNIILIIVNNGDDFDYTINENIYYIKNENLGGSGGFMRGLIEAQSMKGVTHTIFMDDDGACEIESIRRTFSFMSLAKDINVVVSACMIYEDMPAIIHESGALWIREIFHRPDKHLLDLRNESALQSFDEENKIGYGAWWFLALNIKAVKYYAFPFFVRGDDVLFGYMNKEHTIISLNGVASWQMDFARKHSVLLQYLNFRAFVIPALLSKRKLPPFDISVFFLMETFRLCFSCRYENAQAMIMAYIDGMKGKEFWINNADLKEIREKISAITREEVYQEKHGNIINGDYFFPVPGVENKFHKALRLLTMNGHFIPDLFFRKDIVVVDYRHRTPTNYSFLRKKIYYLNSESGYVMELNHSKLKFFSVIFTAIKVVIVNFVLFKRSKKRMAKDILFLTSRDFWLSKFK